MKILALDTSTEACSAALYIDGDVDERFELAPREHTRLILPMIEDLLNQAGIKVNQLDALAFGCGPGSFTGVRISTGIVQGMAFAADLPVVPVSTLASIAQTIYQEYQHPHVLAAIDARMGEVYWSQYILGDEDVMTLIGDESVISPEQVEADNSYNWVGAGTAWAAYQTELNQCLTQKLLHCYDACLPRSSSISQLAAVSFRQGHAMPAEKALPVYLRNNVAQKSSTTK